MTNKINSKTISLAILFGLALAVVVISGTLPKIIDSGDSAPRENVSQIANSSSSIDGALALGTNLHRIADWSTQLPFLDAFKSSRQWITQCQQGEPGCSGSWSTNEYEKLDLDEYGWVKSLPASEDPPEYTRVSTLMFRDVERYPGGQYVVTYEGEGTIEYKGNASKDEAASTPGRDVINVTPSKAGIHLIITATDPNQNGQYIRNIRVVPANYEQNYTSEIFNPDFIARIKKFQALRFMDWMGTNDSEQGEWQNRPQLATASYNSKTGGPPVEIMVELANRLQVDPWFNLPHQATDEYITKFAQIVKDNLDPNLTIYLEYSNEVWNPQFEQFHWVKDNGQIPGGKTPYQSYGVRTAQMCDLWKGVFAQQSDRVKCVM
ncbi:MAG: cellulose-binding protein, partial [Symploca sp. SIO2E6]|nr:cellulose-binding protein [Symploca sp. SIO2E6]